MGGAAREGVFADLGDGGRDGEGFEFGAVLEREVVNSGEGAGVSGVDGGEGGAAIEGVAADCRQAGGEGDGLQGGAALECIATYGGDLLAEVDGGKGGAVREG